MTTFDISAEGFIRYFVDWFNENVADTDVPIITKPDVYCVWFSYVLGNAKCLISTIRPDHRYYELTFNGDKLEVYVDTYVKVNNTEEKVAIL